MPDITRRPLSAALLATSLLPTGAEAAATSHRPIGPTGAAYAMAHLIEHPSRLLFISGQVPTDADGVAPQGFAAQARLAWRNSRPKLALRA